MRFRWPISFAAFSGPVILLAMAAPPIHDPASDPILHAEARVVQIDVVAVDSQGKPVEGLTKEDFRVMDEGKPRPIDIFSVNRGESTAEPVTTPTHPLGRNVFSNRNPGPPEHAGHSTVIVLDQTSSNPAGMRGSFDNAAYAQLQTIELMSKLKPDEQIALYVIARRLGLVLLQDYTTDRELLVKQLRKYIPRGMTMAPSAHPESSGDTGGSPRRDPNAVPERETEAMKGEGARDARLSLQAIGEHLAAVPGRKSVIWVTEGFANSRMGGMDQMAWDKTITTLNEANVAINALDAVGNPGWAPRPPNALQEIAGRTGGQAWAMRNDLGVAMEEGIEASRTTYTLGFYLQQGDRDDKFRALKIETPRRGLQLFYRQGYYAGSTELPDAPWETSSQSDMESALMSRVDSRGVGITARVEAKRGLPRGTLDIRLNLDPETLSLVEKGGKWTGKVEEMVVQMNAGSATLAKISDDKTFEMKPADRTHYEKGGATWPLSVPLMPGATRVVIIVRDAKTGRVGSLSVPLP